MKILHVITGIGRSSGGPARSSQGLVAAECRAGADAWIHSFDGAEPWIEGVRRHRGDLSAEDLRRFDLVHLHGLWDLRLHRVAKACRAAGVPYVVAPRGMLEPWSLAQKRWKKRLARWCYQDRDLAGAVALHATAESEAEQFRRLGFRNPVVVSPNGVNAPATLPARTRGGSRRALYVSRMHPKKGVAELVDAWREAGMEGWECELVYTVSGPEEREYESKVRAAVAAAGLAGRFIFTGALDDEAKWNAYRRADLFVLPTYSENFGIVVAEALYAGVPVVTTKGTPWSELEMRRCGWWIDLPPRSTLTSALRAAAAMPSAELAAMGARGRALVDERYSWDALARSALEQLERAIVQTR